MTKRLHMRLRAAVVTALLANASPVTSKTQGIHQTLDQLVREGKFSGAIVIRNAEGVRFARGYGLADPFSNRAFTPETPVDSASLAKPITAATILSLSRDKTIDLDAPVQRYLPEFSYGGITVRHLLSHSAGLPGEDAFESLTGRENADFLAEMRQRRLPPLFAADRGFAYCNFCYTTLALLIERVTGQSYIDVARRRAHLPAGVTVRPRRLANWASRAIGYRRAANGGIERADSFEDERFYGSSNLSISAAQLALWGTEWSARGLASIRSAATTTAMVDGQPSGLTLGNWYCAPNGRRCHYLGHHEGFHHMLYWDRDARIAVAMVSNNTLASVLQERLQRALVAFATGRASDGKAEIASPLPDSPVVAGRYRLSSGDAIVVQAEGSMVTVERNGVIYRAYRVGEGIRYVPGLDVYLAGGGDGRLRWLSLYEDEIATR